MDRTYGSAKDESNEFPDVNSQSRSKKGSISAQSSSTKKNAKRKESIDDPSKRRCVSSACTACRRRKSKCDGNQPACAACSQVYKTECVYDLASDHRRKGVYKQDIDNLQTRNSTLTTLIEAILNYPQEDVPELIRQIRTCESLDQVAESINAQDSELNDHGSKYTDTAQADASSPFESHLSTRLGQFKLDNDGGTKYYGGTSNLLFLEDEDLENTSPLAQSPRPDETIGPVTEPIASWTNVTQDVDLIMHLLNMYFTWHYSFFVTLSRRAFNRHFFMGKAPGPSRRKLDYCTPLLVNVMLSLGCHFSSWPGAREDPNDPSSAGNHFFKEAKRLLMDGEEYEHPRLATIQAVSLMSVREAGCGREAQGWSYSGIAFRMACDLGLNLDSGGLLSQEASIDEEEEDVRRMTFWGCYLFDKCWSNYLGRLPQFQLGQNITVPKFDVFPDEESEHWSPYTDAGFQQAHSQPSRARAVALQLSSLCEISGDLMKYFYHPQQRTKPSPLAIEIKRLSDIHMRLEDWRRNLPAEFEPREGALPTVFIMHMFFHLLYIHLFRYFLRYDPNNAGLPSNVSPRKNCTHAAAMISRLLRLYKRAYGLRQICNIVVYILHSACTIHLLNVPEKNAKRDFLHGVRQLEEMCDGWPVARRTLCVLALQAKRWEIEVPVEAAIILNRFYERQGLASASDRSESPVSSSVSPSLALNASSNESQPFNQSMWSIEHAMGQYEQATSDTNAWNTLGSGLGTGPQMPSNSAAQFFAADNAPNIATSGQQRRPSSNLVAQPSAFLGDQYAQQSTFQSQQMQQFFELQRQRQALQQRQLATQMTQSASGSAVTTPFEMIPTPTLHGTSPTTQQSYFPNSGNAAQMPPPAIPSSSNSKSQSSTRSQTHSPVKSQQTSVEQTTPSAASSTPPTSRSDASSSIPVTRPSATADMFGGVQALLREGQEWWVNDQGTVAQGFEKWDVDQGPNV